MYIVPIFLTVGPCSLVEFSLVVDVQPMQIVLDVLSPSVRERLIIG